jgi:hypothetical protein
MRDAFRPQYAFTLIPKPRYKLGQTVSLPVYAVNDAQHTARYAVRARVFNPEGKRVAEFSNIGEFAVDCEAEQIGKLEFVADRRGQYEVQIALQSEGERFTNVYRVPVGKRSRRYAVVQRVTQALAATITALRAI